MQECKKVGGRGKTKNKTKRKKKRNGTNTYYLHEYTCFCFVSSLLPVSITPSICLFIGPNFPSLSISLTFATLVVENATQKAPLPSYIFSTRNENIPPAFCKTCR